MNLDFINKKKKTENFSSFVFKIGIFPNLLAAALVFIYSIGFITLPLDAVLPSVEVLSVIVFIAQAIFAPVTHRLITKNLSNKIDYWQTSGLDIDGRTKLLKELLSYPIKKSIETYIHFFLCSIAVTICLYYLLHIDPYIMGIFFIACIIASYISMIAALYNTETICASISKKLVEEGINETSANTQKKKFYGIPLYISFILYIIIPVLLSGIFTVLVTHLGHNPVIIHENNKIATLVLSAREANGYYVRGTPSKNTQLFRMAYVCFSNILLVITLCILFFKKLTNYARQMQNAFTVINSLNLKDAPLLPEDLSNEFSYTIHLANKTILYFKKILQTTSVINNQIIQSTADLSSVSKETESTSITQSTSVEKILATMVNTSNLAKSITLKIEEVINVANKTVNDVNKNFESINENLEKMKEITESNSKTITNIQILCNKIKVVKEIVRLISSITEQTKIIAFNAELEASSLDEENLNFHNVAEEIRTLADKTILLTNDVSSQINSIQKSSELLIQASLNCMKKIEEGNNLTNSLQNEFYGIRFSAISTMNDAEKIKQYSEEQNISFAEIVNALSQINTSVKDFSENTKLITFTVETLKKGSETLEKTNLDFNKIKTSTITENSFNNKGEIL